MNVSFVTHLCLSIDMIMKSRYVEILLFLILRVGGIILRITEEREFISTVILIGTVDYTYA